MGRRISVRLPEVLQLLAFLVVVFLGIIFIGNFGPDGLVHESITSFAWFGLIIIVAVMVVIGGLMVSSMRN